MIVRLHRSSVDHVASTRAGIKYLHWIPREVSEDCTAYIAAQNSSTSFEHSRPAPPSLALARMKIARLFDDPRTYRYRRALARTFWSNVALLIGSFRSRNGFMVILTQYSHTSMRKFRMPSSCLCSCKMRNFTSAEAEEGEVSGEAGHPIELALTSWY